jgi:hypothetical protein
MHPLNTNTNHAAAKLKAQPGELIRLPFTKTEYDDVCLLLQGLFSLAFAPLHVVLFHNFFGGWVQFVSTVRFYTPPVQPSVFASTTQRNTSD